jgi:hypothetical protein
MTAESNNAGSQLLLNERLDFPAEPTTVVPTLSDSAINEKYVKGEVRIVTEQARYPINTIASIVENPAYRLSPEYQRRHRWSPDRQSRLIESLIINVPIPPIFLYEFDYSQYEVMDGLQRLTAIHDFYRDAFPLEGLTEWPELNGRTYSTLPGKVREGIDRRYLSSVILLKETAQNAADALRLKQLVFERINSGGVRLSPQESRNAVFDGPLNQVCIALSREPALCRLWGIPEPSESERKGGSPTDERVQDEAFRTMYDVELVLRFFAYRQKHRLHQSGESLSLYLDRFLSAGNHLPSDTIESLGGLFKQTIAFAESLLGERAFYLYRKRTRGGTDHWAWLERPTTTAYDPLMFVLSDQTLDRPNLLRNASQIRESLPDFYTKNYEVFEGRNVNPSALIAREDAYREFLNRVAAR